MAANTSPIFSRSGSIGQGVNITLAQNTYDGAGANDTLIYTAGSNGNFIQRIRMKARGTNVATVARIYINNGSTNGTASNNSFYGEISLPATTASATAATVTIDVPLNLALPPGYEVYVGLGTAVAAGWSVVGIGGAY